MPTQKALSVMADSKIHTVSMSSPPDDVDTVHSLLEDVWRSGTHVSVIDRISFETALIELVSNVIRHADSGSGITCTLSIEVSTDHIEANLRDTGEPGDVELIGRAMPEDLAESGRGIPLIQALVDELTYEREGNLNRWSLRRKIQS